jgi:hypothetical protein
VTVTHDWFDVNLPQNEQNIEKKKGFVRINLLVLFLRVLADVLKLNILVVKFLLQQSTILQVIL